MKFDSVSRLRDDALLRQLSEVVTRDRATTAEMLALIAEVDERKLFLPAAYPSMYAYCVQELRLSEDSAYKRIRAARTARRFPDILPAVADGRLNLSAIVLLTPYLTEQSAEALLSAAEHKTRSEIEILIAQRFPRTELMSLVESGAAPQLAPGPVETSRSAEHPAAFIPESGASRPARSTVAPQAPDRFALHATIDASTHDDLRRAQELLGHQLPSGDVAEVLSRALRLLVVHLEKGKLAATTRPQRKPRPTRSARHVPAHVKRAVRERDGDRCTFVAENGRRCASRTRLEFDHIESVSRGGEATVGNLRLRCGGILRGQARGPAPGGSAPRCYSNAFHTTRLDRTRGAPHRPVTAGPEATASA